MDLGLKDKVAIVLASSKGLGKGCAVALAKEGCRLAICARGREALETTAKELRNVAGRDVFARVIDVHLRSDRERFLNELLQEHPAIHILVTNSGGPPPGRGLDLSEEEWSKAAESTLFMAVHWARAVAPVMMKQKWGRIIHVASISVKQPIDGLILSNTMRAGVAAFAKTMSRELAPHGILVNTVCPGSHRTDRLAALVNRRAKEQGTSVEEEWKRIEREIPLGRIGVPEEFGAVVAFLASERASYVTGTTIQIDGGEYRGLI